VEILAAKTEGKNRLPKRRSKVAKRGPHRLDGQTDGGVEPLGKIGHILNKKRAREQPPKVPSSLMQKVASREKVNGTVGEKITGSIGRYQEKTQKLTEKGGSQFPRQDHHEAIPRKFPAVNEVRAVIVNQEI